MATFYGAQFGLNGDIPAPGDFDGDNKADLAVSGPRRVTGFSCSRQRAFRKPGLV